MWLGLVAVMLLLTPLAYADPPDPTWQVGVFDDGDFDQVVGMIIAASALADAPAVRCLDPVVDGIVLRGPPSDRPAASVPLSAADPRGPPSR